MIFRVGKKEGGRIKGKKSIKIKDFLYKKAESEKEKRGRRTAEGNAKGKGDRKWERQKRVGGGEGMEGG